MWLLFVFCTKRAKLVFGDIKDYLEENFVAFILSGLWSRRELKFFVDRFCPDASRNT